MRFQILIIVVGLALLPDAVVAQVKSSASDTLFWSGFELVAIPSSADGAMQPAYFLSAQPGSARPLVVSLHSWSGDYTQEDPLAPMADSAGWNYIHPDFRGPNWTLDACLSEKALSDIDDAIQYAIDEGNVDSDNVFIVGSSGGGYAALGAYLRTRHDVRAFHSWVPISDLVAWHHQAASRGLKYADEIVACTSGGERLDSAKAQERSPLFWDLPGEPKSRLEIFAGITDGYTGSVPISHSIRFFNRLVEHFGYEGAIVNPETTVALLTRSVNFDQDLGYIDDRALLYYSETDPVSLTIFDGGHEHLPHFIMTRLCEIVD